MCLSHDLSVVKHISDNIVVMYLGSLWNMLLQKLFAKPVHPYTQALLSAIPIPSVKHKRKRVILKGELTSPINPEPGCRFAKRCIYAEKRCFEEDPVLREIEKDHFISCYIK